MENLYDNNYRKNLGKKHGPRSAQARQNISRAVTIAMNTPEVKKKLRDANSGKTHTPETRKKMSASRNGTKLFNNTVINKLFRPGTEPAGFVLGKLR